MGLESEEAAEEVHRVSARSVKAGYLRIVSCSQNRFWFLDSKDSLFRLEAIASRLEAIALASSLCPDFRIFHDVPENESESNLAGQDQL